MSRLSEILGVKEGQEFTFDKNGFRSIMDMPTSSRLLCFDLSMRADDDGFVNSPSGIEELPFA